jgi:hypothetical protein
MLTFLFWNLNRKPLQARVARLAAAHDVDVVILAEGNESIPSVERRLNSTGKRLYHGTPGDHGRTAIYARFSRDFVTPVGRSSPFISIQRLRLPARAEILLAAAHLPSRLFRSPDSQNALCSPVSSSIRDAEQKAGHSRTILVGDFNLNPFEPGMVGAVGLHGAMTRDLAMRGSRIVDDQSYPFFYNPMWSRLGDGSPGPPGTYYHDRSGHVSYFWNMFDQVLVRPDLLAYFATDDVQILTDDGIEPLLTRKGRPDRATGSDHLPLLFRLEL